MNAKLIFSAALALGLSPINAQQPASDFNAASSLKSWEWNIGTSHWEQILSDNRAIPELHIGRSDFVVSGPIVSGFHRNRLPSDASFGQKFLALPVISWVVPQRMPLPPGGTGKYFAWSDSPNPWVNVSSGLPPGATFNGSYNEPVGTLMSFSRSIH
ncbi:MAG TPA: hypothetical protein VK327_13960 [Candidatus Paceibacterota bacterium]|nr:hypothetical protein [Candidatus Paceibacterota bacterium]